MKIVMIFDQIQSGLGTKDGTMVPLTGKKEAVGPAVMMQPFLENPDEVSRKLCAMVKKLQPDVVICGPAFNYGDYGEMCARVAADINATTESRAFAAMSRENEQVISRYKDQVMIVKTPKKGGLGLNDSLKNMCRVAKAMADGGDLEKLRAEVCF